MIELLIEAERALALGRVDRADELYRQVADADPRNAMAVVGLARVALERRDDLGAYLLARRALVIDPENDAARRLAVRLEEVLATRGEPVAEPLPAPAATFATPPLPVAEPPNRPEPPPPHGQAPAPGAAPAPGTTPAPGPEPEPSPKRRTLLGRFRRGR